MVEMLVTLSIVGVLAIMTIQGIGSMMTDHKTSNATRLVVSALKKTKSAAVEMCAHTQFKYTTSTSNPKTSTITNEAVSNQTMAGSTNTSSKFTTSTVLSKGTTLTGSSSVEFNAVGLTTSAATFFVRNGNSCQRVTVTAMGEIYPGDVKALPSGTTASTTNC